MRGDTNSDVKPNVSSNSSNSRFSTATTSKDGESSTNCRSSISSSQTSSSDGSSSQTELDSQTVSDILLENETQNLLDSRTSSSDSRSSSSDSYRADSSRPAQRTSSSNSSKVNSKTYTKSVSKSRSKNLTETISEAISEIISEDVSSTKQLLNASTSLYTTADECSCDTTLTLDPNVICCSRSSCLISTCCSTHLNYLARLKCNQDTLIEQDETECFAISNLDQYSDDSTPSGDSLNQVKSEDQSTYNQTYTFSQTDDLQVNETPNRKMLNDLKLTNLNDLITRTNFNSTTNQPSNDLNQTNRTNHLINKQPLAEPNSTTSHRPPPNELTDQISSTTSSPLNNEDTTSLSQLTKTNDSIRTSNVPTQQSDTLKPDSSPIVDNRLSNRPIEHATNGAKRNLNNLSNSAKLITMNFEDDVETDELTDEQINKPNQHLHLNTLSDISMLTFPEVDENVNETYKQHASSRCLLDCSPTKRSTKTPANDPLLDEMTYNDVNLLRDFSNTSTAQVRFADEDDHLDVRYADPTINSGDHSSELDSDLDAEFDQDDDELVLLQDADLISDELTTDVYNDANLCENVPRYIDLSKLAQDDNVLFTKTNLDKFVSSKYSI